MKTPVNDGSEFGTVHLKLFKALERMQRETAEVARHPDPDYPERLDYLLNQVMDSAHEILDLAHEFKQATLKHHA
jgi:hypothetical protein